MNVEVLGLIGRKGCWRGLGNAWWRWWCRHARQALNGNQSLIHCLHDMFMPVVLVIDDAFTMDKTLLQ